MQGLGSGLLAWASADYGDGHGGKCICLHAAHFWNSVYNTPFTILFNSINHLNFYF